MVLMMRQGLLLPVMVMPRGHRLFVSSYTARLLGGESQIQKERGEKRADNSLTHPSRLSARL